jgi:glycosyltransferase involved in cell wall biosynthesis
LTTKIDIDKNKKLQVKNYIDVFTPNVTGGVNSILQNLFKYKSQNTYINYIVYSGLSDKRIKINTVPDNVVINKYYYDEYSNKFKIWKKLSKCVSKNSYIIATDSIELEMIVKFKIKNNLIFIVMGDFEHYYSLVDKYKSIIDKFICISIEIHNNLKCLLPDRLEDLVQIYFPTSDINYQISNYEKNKILNLIYVARLETSKNPLLLPLIDDILVNNSVNVNWTIVGDGVLKSDFLLLIKNKFNFKFLGFLNNEDILKLYLQNDIFINTSFCEGLPVTLIEALKSGLIPIVSDISGGIKEVVNNTINGFICNNSKPEDFANKIIELSKDSALLNKMKTKILDNTVVNLNSKYLSNLYYEEIFKTQNNSKDFNINGIGSKLDKCYLPNFLVQNIRKIKFNIC